MATTPGSGISEAVSEKEFLASNDPSVFERPSVTVDAALFTLRNGALSLLLAQRAGRPFQGFWALPGGFLNVVGDASLEAAAYRELAGETGVSLDVASGWYLEQLSTYGDVGRRLHPDSSSSP